nr:unnamed protein product [Callosobruchus analis]
MDSENGHKSETKVYIYRWIILLLFCLCNLINFMQFLQFTIVSDVTQRYYNVDASLVDATGLIFFVTYILFFLPISYLIEKSIQAHFNCFRDIFEGKYDFITVSETWLKPNIPNSVIDLNNYNLYRKDRLIKRGGGLASLRVTLISSISLTAAGSLVKLFSNDPDRFYLVLIGQGLCGIGQVYLMSIPSKLASTWFGSEEVSTACAIGILGSQLGKRPLIVNTSDKILKKNQICELLRTLEYTENRVTVLGIENQEPFLKNCKDLMKNQDFILILISLGIFNGIWNSFGILVNTIYLKYFPDGGTDVGIITLCSIISGGCIGSVIFGIILDKTHKFKKTTIAAMIFATVTFAVCIYMFVTKSRLATFFATPLFGFFIASTLVISFEYALEVTYPIPESISCSVLNAAIFLFAIICTLTFEALFDAIDYIYTFVFILVLMLGCTALIYFISGNLRRRDANLGQSRNSSMAAIED